MNFNYQRSLNRSDTNKTMSSRIPESVRLREKRDAIVKAQQVAEALQSENVWFLQYVHGIESAIQSKGVCEAG